MKCFYFLIVFIVSINLLPAQTIMTGRITDAKNGLPLEGANVWIESLQLGTTSDDRGNYMVAVTQSGEFRVEVSYLGYRTEKFKMLIIPGQKEFTRNIMLSAADYEIQPLVVKATRAGRRTPMTYSEMKKDEIEEKNIGQDVPYLLRWTTSAVVTSDAGTGIGYTGIRIRGSDPTRINVTINGIPLNDAESHQVYWVDLPDFAASTDDIQIQRGVGTSTNGGGAFGASINMNTTNLSEAPYARMNLVGGSFNTLRASTSFGTGLLNEKFILEGRLSKIKSDGYVDRASADLSSFFINSAWMSSGGTFHFNVFSGHEITYQAWNGIPGDYIRDPKLRRYNPSGTEKNGEPYENEVDNYRQTHYQLLWNKAIGAQWSVNTGLHYTRGAGFYEQYKADQPLLAYGILSTSVNSDLIRQRWLDNHFGGLTYALNYKSEDRSIDFTLGGGLHYYDGRHFGKVIWARDAGNSELGHLYYDNNGIKQDFNIFGKLNYAFKPKWDGFIDLQLRGVGYSFLGYDFNFQRVDQDDRMLFFNPKLGVSFIPDEQSETYLSVAVAQREPNRDDYVSSTPLQRPRSEFLLNTEMGYRWRDQVSALSVNLFHMWYKNQLVLNGRINDVGAYTRINVPRSYRIGVEFEGRSQLSDIFSLRGNITVSNNKIVSYNEYEDAFDQNFEYKGQVAVPYDRSSLAFSPSLIAAGEIGIKATSGITLNLLNKYVSSQFLDNTGDSNNQLKGYYIADVQLLWIINKNLSLNIQMLNAFNHFYVSNGWSYRYRVDDQRSLAQGYFPQAGRHFLVSLNFSF
jgi:iron complex outermembrane recepter protein